MPIITVTIPRPVKKGDGEEALPTNASSSKVPILSVLRNTDNYKELVNTLS